MTTTVLILDGTGAQYDLNTNATSSYTVYIPPGATGTWSWVAEQYRYNRQSGTFSPASGGAIGFSPNWVSDDYISVITSATVSAYTTFSTLDQLYDFSAYERTQSPFHVVMTASAGKIYTSANIIIDTTASIPWSYNSVTDTLTINATVLASGAKLTSIQTTGAISTVNGASITSVYTDSSGTSSKLIFSGLVASTILITDNTASQYDLQLNKNGSFTEQIATTATGTWNWVVESYGYTRQTAPVSFTGGEYSAITSYLPDSNITVTSTATVAAYTEILTLSELYDYAAYMRTQEPMYVLASKNGSSLDFGSVNIVLDPAAASVWSFNATTQTLTIKSSSMASTAKFTTLLTTGVIDVTTTVVTALYTGSAGPSARLNLSGLSASTLYVTDSSNTQYDLQFNKTGTYTDYFVPALTGTYNWVTERYGYGRLTGTFTPITGGDINVIASWIPDVYVTTTNSATVSAYTSFADLSQLYDYAAYYRTLYPKTVIVSKVGSVMNFGATNIIIDSAASSVWNYDSVSDTLTIKSTTLAIGGAFTTITTSGVITFLNIAKATCFYNDSIGSSDHLIYTNLTNTTIYTTDNTGAQYDLQLNKTGTYTNYISNTAVGTWNWVAERYSYQRQSGSLTPASLAGDFLASPSWSSDAKISVSTTATVAAYTTISTLDQLYDYAAYMRTQQPMYVLASSNGTILEMGSTNIIFNSAASAIWNYDSGTNTLTIKSASLASGSNFNLIKTTGTITITGTIMHALYTGAAGPSARLTYSNLINSAIYTTTSTNSQYDLQISQTGTLTDYFVPGLTGTYKWAAERFGYQRQTGAFTPNSGGDFTAIPLWITDTNITETSSSTVASYPIIGNVDQLYDYLAYMRTQLPQYIIATASGTTIDFGSTNITVNKDAASVCGYDSVTNTLTIKADLLMTGTLFTKLKTTGLISTTSTEVIEVLYTDTSGNTAHLNYLSLIESTTLTLDNVGVFYDSGILYSGSSASLIGTGTTGNWTWNVERYGYRRQSGTFVPSAGGDVNVSPVWTIDSFITQSTRATVAAYTVFTTLDQLYDYAAYMRTQEPMYVLASTVGTTINFGSTNVVVDATAPVIWSYNPTNDTLTIKSTILAAGIKNVQLLTTGTLTFANGASATAVYTNNIGSSTNFTISNIPTGASLYISDNTGTEVKYLYNTSASSVITYIAPGASGNWTWTVEKYGNQRQSYSFTPSGGIQTVNVIVTTDTSITNITQTSVAAYTQLETADKIYDYIAYYRLSNAGIKLGNIATHSGFAVDFGTRSLTVNNTASNVITITNTLITIKAPSLSTGDTFTRLITATPGLITSANNEPINLKFADALGARATISGLDPQGFGNIWYMRYKLSTTSTWAYTSGTGDGVNLLVANGTYSFQVREAGYEWATASLDTTNSLDLNINLQYHQASDQTPQWNKPYDAVNAAIMSYDPVALKVAVENATGILIQENFAEMYQAMQRIMHLPTLVWVWTNPVKAVAATQTIIIPVDNPIRMFLTANSNASVRVTCQIVMSDTGAVAFDRVQGNSSGFAIFLGTSQASEIASLRTDIVADVVARLGGAGFATATNSLEAITTMIADVVTLPEIEASTVLAKEATLAATKAKVDTMVSDVWSAPNRTLLKSVEQLTGWVIAEDEMSGAPYCVIGAEPGTSQIPASAFVGTTPTLVDPITNVTLMTLPTVIAIHNDVPFPGLVGFEFAGSEVISAAVTIGMKLVFRTSADYVATSVEVNALPTLPEIEASTILAKEVTVIDAVNAARLAAALSA